jgi:hypothetical protein
MFAWMLALTPKIPQNPKWVASIVEKKKTIKL